MTKEEFEQRTGASVTPEEYTGIEQIYLNAQFMEKDEFCRNWNTKTGRRAIMDALVKQIYTLNEKNHNTGLINAELTEKQDGIIDFLIGNPDVAAMRQKAIELLGDEREYIRRKCERSLPLDDEDKAAILRLL